MTPCPDQLVLERYFAGVLDGAEATTVGGHLETCESCSGWLDRARRDDSLLADLHGAMRTGETVAEEVWRAGQTLAGYRIVREIGRGGMGVVYEAEQQSPRRSVALKVMQPSVAPPRRLEREAEALGRLQHAGIAQIFEAGTFEGPLGVQPFFAMELVHGKRLDQYATEAGLGRRERFDLLIRIADAVHHAHQKGVIHRDLKPANILVDEAGQPKVLDFGVAQLSHDGESATMQTGHGLAGTIPYMSPEQAAGDADAIDTRADVYGLGVLAFQLASGRLPHDLADTTVTAALRIVSEEEPPLLGTLDPSLRGDLETIVAKALERDKERRYASASDLARDLERYLRDEPIVARPPTASYQLRKFAKRHRVLVGAAATVVLALGAGIVATALEARRARRAEGVARSAENAANAAAALAEQRRQEAVAERIDATSARDFLQEVLILASPEQQTGEEPTIREVLDAALTRVGNIEQPRVEAAIRHTLGRVLSGLGRHEEAFVQLERSLRLFEETFGKEDQKVAVVLMSLARSQLELYEFDAAADSIRRARSMREVFDDPAHDLTLATVTNGLGLAMYGKGRLDRAVEHFELALEQFGRLRNEEQRRANAALTLGNLAMTLGAKGEHERAEELYRKAIAEQSAALGPENPQVGRTLNNFARLLVARRRHGEAVPVLRRALAIRRAKFGDASFEVALTERQLGEALFHLGKREEGLALARAAVARERRARPGSATLVHGLLSLSRMAALDRSGDEAVALGREAVEIAASSVGADHALAFEARLELGRLLVGLRRASDAEGVLARAYRFYRERPELGRHGRALVSYAQCLLILGKAPEAIAILEPAAAGKVSKSVLSFLATAYEKQGEHAKAAAVRRRIQ